MGLTTCTECNGSVSSLAKTCPHCGYERQESAPQVNTPSSSGGGFRWLLLAAGSLGLMFIVMAAGTPDYVHEARELRQACEKIAPLERDECRRIHDRYIAEAKARGAK